MKRLHIHVAVNELTASINFYSSLFNSPPSLQRVDYAKWDLHDPAVNFAISQRGHASGINHLGIQVDSAEELEEIAQRLDKAQISMAKQTGSSCCYAQSNKHWVQDPQGIAWESFHTMANIAVFGEDTAPEDSSSPCCIPLHNADTDDNEVPCCIPNKDNASGCCAET